MIVNLWMGFDDRAQSSAKEPDEFGQFSDAYNSLGDKITPSLFKTDDPPGPRTYELWSLYYEAEDDNAVLQIRNDLNAVYPGQLRTVASFWYAEGNQVGTENVYETHIEEQTWNELNPDYQPDPELPDFDDRYVISVTGDVEVTTVTGHTGNPIFPATVDPLDYMPDVWNGDEPPTYSPATDITDVNLGAGQAPRNFL